MISKRQLVMCLLVPLLAVQLACHKKQAAQKPKLPGPAEAPTLAQTLPDAIQPQPLPKKPEENAQSQEPPPLPKKAKTRKKQPASANTQAKGTQAPAQAPSPQPPAPTTTAELQPPATPPNAAAEVAIGADIPSAVAARDRQSTTNQLDNTENQLKRVDSNNLSSDQQAMLTQIKTYISQSRKAISEGDYERASNLAKKAQVLTDELMKK